MATNPTQTAEAPTETTDLYDYKTDRDSLITADETDHITVWYSSAYGDVGNLQEATGSIDTVDVKEWVSEPATTVVVTFARTETDETDRKYKARFYEGELFTAELLGLNGARWQTISRVSPNPAATVTADSETETDGGQNTADATTDRPNTDERVTASDVTEGDRIHVALPRFVRDETETETRWLANAEVTRVHRGRHVRNRDTDEYEYREDLASDFSFECDGWLGTVYCDRADWKLSIGQNPTGEYVPDCSTAGVYMADSDETGETTDDTDAVDRGRGTETDGGQTTDESEGETHEPAEHRPMYPESHDWTGIKNKIEGIVSLGGVVCDICKDMSPDTRPNYTTDTPTLHIDVTGETLGDWMGTSLCPVHADGTTQGTHKVHCRMTDETDRRNAYAYRVVSIEAKEPADETDSDAPDRGHGIETDGGRDLERLNLTVEIDETVTFTGETDHVPQSVLTAVRQAFEDTIGHAIDGPVHWKEPSNDCQMARFVPSHGYPEMPVIGDGGTCDGWLPPYRASEKVHERLMQTLPDSYEFQHETRHVTGIYPD